LHTVKEAEAVWNGPDALRGSLILIADLEPWPGNPRQGDVGAISESLKRFGQLRPIVVRGTRIVAGHHVVLAARALGWSHVAVIDPDFADETEARAYLIADNRLSELGTTDDSMLVAQLEALGGALDGTGFSGDDLGDLHAQLEALARLENKHDPDDVPEPPAEPVSKRGEVYALGDHRLMCGDATDQEDVDILLAGERPTLAFTSPPYALNLGYSEYEDTIDNLRILIRALATTWRDAMAEESYMVLNYGDVIGGAKIAGTDEPCGYPMAIEYWPVFREAGWLLDACRAWTKPHGRVHAPWTANSNRAASDWEHIWTWRRPGTKLNERRSPSYFGTWEWRTLGTEQVDIGKDIHPAGFPTYLPRAVMTVYSNPGDPVVDPLAGTGTTMIAAEIDGRRCFAMEIDPIYCDVIRRRYAAYVDKPELDPGAGS
jgi:DNA modification methylase